MRYDYKMIVYDVDGNKLHFTAEQEPNQYDAEMLAEEWAVQGGVDIDWIECVSTTDPQGIIETGNWGYDGYAVS